jgi:hypothetical protein
VNGAWKRATPRYVEAVRGLTSDELDLLAVLALAEPLNITNFLRQASAVRIPEFIRAVMQAEVSAEDVGYIPFGHYILSRRSREFL